MRLYKIALLLPLFLSACKSLKPLDFTTLKIVPLTKNVFVHISYLQTEDFGLVPCNGMLYVQGDEVVVFDTPADIGASDLLITWIERHWKKRIKAVVINHFHVDCLGGLANFHAHKIPSYASNRTIRLVTEKGEGVVPQNGFDSLLTLQCGGKTIENRFFGEAHTIDNIVSYLPAEKTLFGGCMIKALGASKGWTGDANITAWPATVAAVKQAYPDLQYVVPGHGDAGGMALLDYTIKLFSEEK